MANQNPEQIARDHIDQQLMACGWVKPCSMYINPNASKIVYKLL